MKWNEVTWFSRLCGIVIFLGIIPYLFLYIGLQFKELAVTQERITQMRYLENVVEKPLHVDMARNYFSPDGTYNLRVNFYSDKSCLFRLEDADGYIVSPAPELKFNKMMCSYGEMDGQLYTGFIKWLDNKRFLISEDDFTITLVNLQDKSATPFIPALENGKYMFHSVDDELKNWVYRQRYEGEFIILDSDLAPRAFVGKEMNKASAIFYDSANHAFVVLGKNYKDGSQQSLVVTYVSLDSYEVRKILETEFIYAPGGGCNSWGSIRSILGEVRLEPGNCYDRTLPSYVIEQDGLIHIPL